LALEIPTRLNVREGRRFGFTLGLAFLGLGGLAWWRGRGPVAGVFWVAAGVLLLSALLVPARLRPVERAWMRWARLISLVTTPILIGVVFFVVITPTAILMRALGRNPLTSRPDRDTFWIARGEVRRSDLRRQF
jgi:Saxitoxin biosynthesis operon protein SxtJ